MPVRPACPLPEPHRDIFWPDVRPEDKFRHAATHQQGYNEAIPPNVDELPPEEQERIKNRYRYGGIKLRHDIKDEHVPLARETMDL